MFGQEKCGCHVVYLEFDDLEIEYCPLHTAAPDLYEALKLALNFIGKGKQARIVAEQALAKAENKDA